MKQKLNFQRPQSQKLFSGRFINTVHLAHAPIIIEQKWIARCIISTPSLTDRQTFIFFFFMKKDISRLGAHWKYLFRSHYWHLLFFYVRRQYLQEVDVIAWVMEMTRPERNCYHCIIWSLFSSNQRIASVFATRVSLPKRLAKATPIWRMETGRF